MAREDLEARMRDLLAKASVIPEAPAATLDSEKTTGSKAGSAILAMRDTSLHDQFAKAFRNCQTDGDRVRAIEWAEKALEGARRPPQPEKGMAEPGSLAWKREIAAAVDAAKSGSEVKEIARRFSISRATAYNYRRQYGQSEAA